MSERPIIFVSHAAEDKAIALQMKTSFDQAWTKDGEYLSEVEVFVSSASGAIGIGQDWFSVLITKLQKAKILVVLLTKNSIAKPWVWFEIGFFWNRKLAGESVEIFPLYEDGIEIPSPIDTLQAKCFTDPDEQLDFNVAIAVRVALMLHNLSKRSNTAT